MPPTPRRRPLGTLLSWAWRVFGVAVAVASVVFLWRYPWGASLRALFSAHGWLIALALAARAVAVMSRSERNHAMLRGQVVAGRVMIARYVLCRTAADNLLAGWTGIGVQTWLLVQHGHAKLSSVVGALALEKYLDVTAVAFGIGVVVHWKMLPLGWSEARFMSFLAVAIALLAVGLACGRFAPRTQVGRALGPAARAFGSPSQGLWVVTTTAIVWGCEVMVLATSMRATGLSLTVLQAIMLTSVAMVAFLVPGVPAGAGTVEAALVAALRIQGVGEEEALTCALIYHAVQVVPETLLGLVAMKGLGVGVRGAQWVR